MEESNKSLQADEIFALSAIYETDWIEEDSVNKVYSMIISNKNGQNIVNFQVILPESYPLYSPPIYQISAPWMNREAKKKLCSELEEVYSQNVGQCIIFLWIEVIKTFIDTNFNVTEKITEVVCLSLDSSKINQLTFDELPLLQHGEPITDRKSVFQAHVAKIISEDQVNQVLQKLKENKKIASAAHNIVAYRISCGNANKCILGCDDDGETRAGSQLLHLLQILDVSDVLVVVSRWYGGIHLGPDRFKHIKNAARNLLLSLGYIAEAFSKP